LLVVSKVSELLLFDPIFVPLFTANERSAGILYHGADRRQRRLQPSFAAIGLESRHDSQSPSVAFELT
jgi:hypothetical protein